MDASVNLFKHASDFFNAVIKREYTEVLRLGPILNISQSVYDIELIPKEAILIIMSKSLEKLMVN